METVPVYGVPYNTDGVSNNSIQNAVGISIRFRAIHTGTFVGIKNFWIFSTAEDGRPGYGAGTGGHVVVELRTDDGTANHAPTSTVLSSFDIPDPMNRDGGAELNPPVYAYGHGGLDGRHYVNFWEITMPAAAITSGTLYHIVYRNIDPAPAANFVSLDHIFNVADTPNMQPGISDTDLASFRYSGSPAAWNVRYSETPIYEVHYSDGFKQGFGYQNSSISDPRPIWGVNKARTVFTPPSTFVANAVKVRLKRVGAPGALKVRLIDDTGCLLARGSITGVPATDTWVSHTFKRSKTLTAGREYRCELFATGSTNNRYSIFGFLDGGWAHFTTQPFPEGRAQVNTGSGWIDTYPPVGGVYSGGDWQLYFTG